MLHSFSRNLKVAVRAGLVLILSQLLFSGSEPPARFVELTASILSTATETGWEPSGKTEYFKGEELFLHINGGAEIYYKHGFQQVSVVEVTRKESGTFLLEIYDMSDSAGALAIYSHKHGESGRDISLGEGGLMENYFINFHKGRYLVTITAYDTERNHSESLLGLAGVVDKHITSD